MRLDTWAVRLIVGAVVFGWLASLGASMISTFEPPDSLNAPAAAVQAYAATAKKNDENRQANPLPERTSCG